MLHEVGRPEAAIAFAYCEWMYKRLEDSYGFDVTFEPHEMKGSTPSFLEAYATARICKDLVKAVYEGRIYGDSGKFSIVAVHAHLKVIAEEQQTKFSQSSPPSPLVGDSFESLMDYAYWRAAIKMQSWRFVG